MINLTKLGYGMIIAGTGGLILKGIAFLFGS